MLHFLMSMRCSLCRPMQGCWPLTATSSRTLPGTNSYDPISPTFCASTFHRHSKLEPVGHPIITTSVLTSAVGCIP